MKIREILYKALPVLFLLIFTWWRASAMLARLTDPDPGLFEAFAYHIQQGKLLYVDIWDHKPPLIFFLNKIFLDLFGTSENAISYGSLIFSLVQTVVFYLLLKNITKNQWVAFLGTAVFIATFYSVFIFGSGNYTEQYAVLFTSLGLLSFLHMFHARSTIFIWLSGISFGTAIWFKEPFLFSAIPYFGILFYWAIKEKTHWKYFAIFFIAFIIPSLIISNYLALTGSWLGFKEQLEFSRIYSSQIQHVSLWLKLKDNFASFFGTMALNAWLIFTFWLVGAMGLLYSPKTRIFGLLLISQQAFDYVAIGWVGNRFFHYYLQSYPVTAIIVFAGIWQWTQQIKMNKGWLVQYSIVFTLSFWVFFAAKPWQQLKSNPEKTYADPILEYLDRYEFSQPRSIAMGGKDIGFYLLRARGISELRYIVPYPYHWIQMPRRQKNYPMIRTKVEFVNWMPEYVIYSGTWAEMYTDCGLDAFILENYHEVKLTDMMPGATAHLLKRNTE